jgi:DNA-binding NarL/FixJ family response regulator
MEPVLEFQRVVVIDDDPLQAISRTVEHLERVSKDGFENELTDAVRSAARRGSVRPRVTIDGLVEAAGRLDPDDVPILGMLVHGTSPADIGEVLGVHERELAGRRRRMLHALLGEPRAVRGAGTE